MFRVTELHKWGVAVPLGDGGRRQQKFKVILRKFLLLKQHAALPSEPERLQRLEFPPRQYLPNTHYVLCLALVLKPLTESSPALCCLYSQPASLGNLESHRRFSSGMRATYPHQSTNDAQPPPPPARNTALSELWSCPPPLQPNGAVQSVFNQLWQKATEALTLGLPDAVV